MLHPFGRTFHIKIFCLSLRTFLNRERANLTKGNRRLEKKLKEAALGMEEERRNTDQYKDQVGICNFLWTP